MPFFRVDLKFRSPPVSSFHQFPCGVALDDAVPLQLEAPDDAPSVAAKPVAKPLSVDRPAAPSDGKKRLAEVGVDERLLAEVATCLVGSRRPVDQRAHRNRLGTKDAAPLLDHGSERFELGIAATNGFGGRPWIGLAKPHQRGAHQP